MIEKFEVRRECICDADQTRLCYQKLPNSACVGKAEKSSYRGAKEMKDKTGVTLMVCISADGWETKAAATYGQCTTRAKWFTLVDMGYTHLSIASVFILFFFTI